MLVLLQSTHALGSFFFFFNAYGSSNYCNVQKTLHEHIAEANRSLQSTCTQFQLFAYRQADLCPMQACAMHASCRSPFTGSTRALTPKNLRTSALQVNVSQRSFQVYAKIDTGYKKVRDQASSQALTVRAFHDIRHSCCDNHVGQQRRREVDCGGSVARD